MDQHARGPTNKQTIQPQCVRGKSSVSKIRWSYWRGSNLEGEREGEQHHPYSFFVSKTVQQIIPHPPKTQEQPLFKDVRRFETVIT